MTSLSSPALLAVLASLAMLSAAAPAASRAETGRGQGQDPPPNILFAIADDWGVHAGVYGTPWVETPGFDRVAREGVLFTKAYTPVAKCAPSRAIVLTGRHAWQLEEAGNHLAIFPPKFKSWPETLAERGWHVGLTGKGWAPGTANDAEGRPRPIAGTPYQKRRLDPPTKAISNNDYAANFADFLDDAPEGAPWCFWFGAAEPHRRYEFQSGVKKGGKRLEDIDRVPAYWPDNETVRHDMLDYAFEVEWADSHLVRMLDELEKRGLLERTVVIVTSDHGMPFPRGKGYAYPDSNHVPLAVRKPGGGTSAGRVVDDYVSFIDIAPTVLDLAGVPQEESGMAPITGRSWRNILESERGGRVEEWRDHVLVGKERNDVGRPYDWGYPIRGIVRDDFLFLRNYEPSRWPAGNPETGYLDTDAGPTKTVILEAGRKNRDDPHWKLSFGMRPEFELYHLEADPDAVENLAQSEEHRATAERLLRELETRLHEQGDPRMFGMGHLFDEYPVHKEENRNFYERYMNGQLDRSHTGWVDPSDYEDAPIATPTSPGESR